jgi:GT2 family glycosyltransferase
MDRATFPRISVIIPTKYRPADLERTVSSILEQSLLPKQLIIVDQSDQMGNRERVEALFALLPEYVRERLELCYVHDSTIKGPIAARNRGMAIASAEIFAFFDDDVRLEQSYFEELLRVYRDDPDVAGVSGIITNYEFPVWYERIWASLFVRGNFRDERQSIYWRANELQDSKPIRVLKFTGACMSFRSEIARGHWFDENLPNTYEEDWDFCVSLGRNTRLVIAPRARLLHFRSAPGRSNEHHLRNEVRSTHYLYRKHWNRGVNNLLAFWWINLGYGVLATVGSLRRWSFLPWRAFISGASEGTMLAQRFSR